MTGVPLAFGIDDVYSGTGSCPYCTADVTSNPEHFQAKHLKHAIYFEDNGIQKYCIPCFCLKSQQRKRCHWHCPKCQHILCRAPDFRKHLHNHDFAVMDKVPNKLEEGPTENPKARQHVRQEQPPVICIDERNGVFVTPKDVHGPRVPIHVKKHIVSASIACESPLCRDFMRIGVESGNPGMECDHLQRTNRAVCYSAPPALREDSLQSMVDSGLMSKTRQDECLQLRSKSITSGVDCVFPIFWHEQTSVRFIYFSVFTGVRDNWCQFERTRVSFDSHVGQWHCQCRNKMRSCVHRYLSMWWLFQEKPHLLSCQTDPNAGDSDVDERVRDVAETEVAALASTDIQGWTDYLWRRKRVPEDLPEDLSTKERQIPAFFEPLESNCPYCPGPTPPALGERVLITRRGTVYGVSSVTRGVPVYVKNCLVCRRPVRFQEYQSGFHNYDNRTFLTVPLCSLLTSGLANHIALGRFLKTMEDHANITVPHNLIRKAFYHFSALREYSYSYSCVRCGHSPPVLIADGNWKIAFDLPAHLFRRPNLDNISEEDTQVNVRTRWETIEKKMISSGFCDGNTFANPYACPLTYTAFTPWLGNCSRISDIVPKTEVFKGLSQKDRAFTSSCGLEMDEDTILQVLESKTPKREALVKACKALGVSHVGSTTDLINRLEELLIKLQKAGGGVLHMTCTHSVVYYQSALWWQESARDHGDALLSFKHPPTVFVSDIAGRVARHVNNRTNQRFFQPYDGRLCANTAEHIQAAAENLLEVRFPWVTSVGFSSRTVSANEATNSSDRFSSLHPVTGTSARFSLYDRFHQKNQRRQEELLRSLKLAPHLAALVNSSVAEQLNRELSSSKYSLCQMKDEHYMFSLRLYFHVHNKRINDKYTKTLNMQAKQAVHIGLHGKLTFRSEGSATAVPEVLTSSREPRTDCWGRTNIRARKEIPDFQLQNPPNPLLDHVLDETQSPEEIIGAVGTTVLKRLDLMSLGLNQEVEATVVNCCLSQLSIISGQKGKDVHAVNSYAVATWQPPLNCNPFLSLPADSSSKDCIIFPLCKSSHWTLCVLLPKLKRIHILDSTDPSGYGDTDCVSMFSSIAIKMIPGSWKLVKNKDVPAQSASVDCGVFMLMVSRVLCPHHIHLGHNPTSITIVIKRHQYALYMALNWEFDFTQHDMVHIRRWWVNLILSKIKHARKKRCTSAMSEAFKEETKQQEKVQNIGILMLPDAVLSEILLHVVLEEGDAALLNLSLVCSKFRSLVDTDSFRKRAHFCWLDSVTKWRTKSEPCQEFFKMYTLQPCRHCNEVYKTAYQAMLEEENEERCKAFTQKTPIQAFAVMIARCWRSNSV